MFRPNDKFGPYTLVRRLGQGQFGVVWLAKRQGMVTTQVALKMPLDDGIDLNTVKGEAEVWVKASGHPNVLPIIEADIYDSQIVIVSEYAPDGSLEDWLKKHGGQSPSIEVAVELVFGILAGLTHLHAQQIIHRDLKPANIMLQGETPRLADFGIARVLDSSIHSNFIAGSPPYMAPEAFDGVRSVQTDVWSAGVICYQLVAGRLPFPQTDSTALLGAILRNNPALLPQSVPGWLQKVIARALEKNPARRYQSASEMREAMRKVNRSPKPDDGGLAPVSDEIETIVRPPKRPKSSPPETGNRFLKSAAGIIVSLVTIIAGIIGVIQYRQSRPGYDLTGEWKITNTIEATSYNPYQGLRLGYRVFLQQRGHDISGSGEKWWENEKEIPFRYHSPITVTGTIKDDKISLTVVEQGSRRQTTGTFTWVATTKDDRSWKMTRKADHLTGTFTSTAANSSGSSVGERIN